MAIRKTTTPKAARTLSGKKLGEWKVKRVGKDKIELTIPKGMKLQGDDLTIDDILAAGANFNVVKAGRVLACCGGNVAIA